MNSKASSSAKSIVLLVAFFLLATMVVICSAGTGSEKERLKNRGEEELSSSKLYKTTAGSSKMVLTVEGMSCSGCIFTIKSSLSGFEGVNETIVDVVAGKAEVYFDNKKLKKVDRIPAAITASGYPAKIDKIVAAEEVKKNLDLMATRSQLYIASVGDLDISRGDFETELAYAKRKYSRTYGKEAFLTGKNKAALDRLKAQIVSRMIDEGAQLQEIQEDGYKIDEATVSEEFRKFLETRGVKLDDFKASLKKDGESIDQFMKKFEKRVLVKRYLDEEIFSGASNEFEKRRRYSSWLKNTKLLARVVYYDKDLELLVKNQSGGSCSGSCSSSRSGKGSCCSIKAPRKK